DRAISEYSKAIEIEPADAVAYSGRGGMWQRKGDLKLAIRDYGEAIRLQPDEAAHYVSRGLASLGIKNFQSAVGDLDQALLIKPGDAAAHLIRGLALDRMGIQDRATADFDRAVQLADDDVTALRQMAWRLSAGPCGVRDGRSAIKLIDKALTLDSDPFLHELRALALIEAGEFEKAIEAYEAALATSEPPSGSSLAPEGARQTLGQNLQRALIRNGYAIEAVSGVFDPVTRQALIACVLSGCRPRLGIAACAAESVPPPSRNLQAALRSLGPPEVAIEDES
ncbi:MAG: tetratricopeptide repeat protein, partial [Gammaproteobacteria bacterium]|nr:tetratricopeptide repeat protein [Gammaproteobacteria bacterium]